MLRLLVVSALAGILIAGSAPGLVRGEPTAPGSARTVVVPSNVPWTTTGIRVRRGQLVRFQSSGEIHLSFSEDDTATADGSRRNRFAEKSPLPAVPVGALIGRVNSGKPFAIGDLTNALEMPSSGTLFLGVNDDHVPDNSGNYVVKVIL